MWCERKLFREDGIVCRGGEKGAFCRDKKSGNRSEEEVCRGGRSNYGRGRGEFVRTKKEEVAGEDGVCRIGRGNCGRVKGEFVG